MNIITKTIRAFTTEKAVIKNFRFTFPNRQEAFLVFPGPMQSAGDVITALDLAPYRSVILNLGNSNNFTDALMPKILQLFSRGIATAALDADALIIDTGLPVGVMDLMGKGVADRGYKSTLLGIAPADKVSFQDDSVNAAFLDGNHSHFILTEEGNWQSESIINNIITELICRPVMVGKKQIERRVPALATVTGGNEATKYMLLQAVRLKLPLVVVAGSGGIADQVVTAFQAKEAPLDDPAMAEIIADGKLFFHSLNMPAPDIQHVIAGAMVVDKVLSQAWETFADYNLNAGKQQKRFDKLQLSIIIVGVIGTALALTQQVLKPAEDSTAFVTGASGAIYIILIIIPVALTILVTVANRFKQGNKWLLLRAAAESIKREIFRYRTRTNDYTTQPEQQLTKKIEDITRRTMHTEVNASYLAPYNKNNGFPPDMFGAQGMDDGFSKLDPEKYINIRLGDQLNYFKTRAVDLGKQLSILSIIIFIVGGIGTFLAAIHQPVWIALTTTVMAAFGTYLGYRQTENTLTKYNQTATNLANIKAWWNALTETERGLQVNINTLVEHTEQVLQVELDGWVQQMQNALAELRKNQEPKPERNENRLPEERLAQGKKSAQNEPQQPVEPGNAPITSETTADSTAINEGTASVEAANQKIAGGDAALTEQTGKKLASEVNEISGGSVVVPVPSKEPNAPQKNPVK